MARRCDCCRKCHYVIARSDGDMPIPEKLEPLQPYIGILVDAAAAFDALAEDGELASAAEFIAWLIPEVDRSWVQYIRTETMATRPILRAHDYR